MTESEPNPEPTERILRSSRRALLVVLALILFFSATFIAHMIRPGSLLADWAGRAPWLLPLVIIFGVIVMYSGKPVRPDAPEVRAVMQDEFRRLNLARAQRLTLIIVLLAQAPLAILLSDLTTVAAVTVMAVSTITIGMATMIISFLVFDRE